MTTLAGPGGIPTSTVPVVRAWLTTSVAATVAAAKLTEPAVEVYQGLPDHETANDVIAVTGVHRTADPGAMVGGGGAHWLRETYTVELLIDCFAAGADDSFTAVDARAYHLLTLVETSVRNDPTLGGLVLRAQPMTSESVHEWDESHQGARCLVTAHIQVHAEL